MIDSIYIIEMLKKGTAAIETAKTGLNRLSFEQLNWKPDVNEWSIGQCMDHLIICDCSYFPFFKKITDGKFEMNFWENWSPLSGLFGKILVSQVNETTRKKLNAPGIFIPSQREIDMGIVERFYKHLDSLLNYIADCNKIDVDKTHITSPVSKIVTYSLRNAITLIIQHLHRHINQAIKVKSMKGFPLQ
jgi:hypothetical protein